MEYIPLTHYNYMFFVLQSNILHKKYYCPISYMSETTEAAIREYYQESMTTEALKIQIKVASRVGRSDIRI